MQVESDRESTTELDTHADTCCFGQQCVVLSHDTANSVTVSGFSESMVELEVPIATVAVAYDDEATHSTFILIFHQVLYVESMQHNLVSPFQI